MTLPHLVKEVFDILYKQGEVEKGSKDILVSFRGFGFSRFEVSESIAFIIRVEDKVSLVDWRVHHERRNRRDETAECKGYYR
jgi:hypothetical protein